MVQQAKQRKRTVQIISSMKICRTYIFYFYSWTLYTSASKYALIFWVPRIKPTSFLGPISTFNLHPTSLNQPPEGHEISLPSLCPWKCLRPWPSLGSSALARAPGASWRSTSRRLHWTALRGLGAATRWCLASRLHFLIERDSKFVWWPAMTSILAFIHAITCILDLFCNCKYAIACECLLYIVITCYIVNIHF